MSIDVRSHRRPRALSGGAGLIVRAFFVAALIAVVVPVLRHVGDLHAALLVALLPVYLMFGRTP